MRRRRGRCVGTALLPAADRAFFASLDERHALERLRARKTALATEIDGLRQELASVSQELEVLRAQKQREDEQRQRSDSAHSELSDDERRSLILAAKRRFNSDSSRGIEFLVEKKLIELTPDAVAAFLADGELIDKRVLGEYLGDGKPFQIEVLSRFVALQDFTGLSFDKALRKFLALFRLPGEAQKIDRMMERFALRYHENNPGVFASSGTAPSRLFAPLPRFVAGCVFPLRLSACFLSERV